MRNRFRNVSFLSDGFYDNYIPFMPKNQVFSVIFRLLIFELSSVRPPFFENEFAFFLYTLVKMSTDLSILTIQAACFQKKFLFFRKKCLQFWKTRRIMKSRKRFRTFRIHQIQQTGGWKHGRNNQRAVRSMRPVRLDRQ